MCDNFQYAIFGKITKGDDTLIKLEGLPTRTEGIFVMASDFPYFSEIIVSFRWFQFCC